jgi:tetratricopeptide (TPR) repeat protein
MLDAYFAREELAEITVEDMLVLEECYPLIAFACGLEKANKFAEVFAASPAMCFAAKAQYYSDSRLDKELSALDREGVSMLFVYSYISLCKSLTRLGRYGEALDILGQMLKEEILDNRVFQMLYAIETTAPEDHAIRARGLCDLYAPIYDEAIDLQDLSVTGYLGREGKGGKAARLYQKMKPEEFEDLLARESRNFVSLRLADALDKASNTLDAKGQTMTAIQYALRLAAYDRRRGARNTDNLRRLSGLFAKAGNEAMAKYLSSDVESPEPAADQA